MLNDAPVLLIDDSPEDLELALAALATVDGSLGVVAYSNPGAALEWLKLRGASLPRLVLLDWKMPGMGGRDALQMMRADPALSGLPIVVFTTSLEEGDVRRAYDLGANAFVRKPAGFAELERVLADTLRFWSLTASRACEPAA